MNLRSASCLSYHCSIRNCIVLFFFAFLFSYFALSIAATLSSSRFTKPISATDWRFKGINRNGWSGAEFEFIEPRIYPWSARVNILFETNRPKEAGPASVKFEVNGLSIEPQRITKDPIQLSPGAADPSFIHLKGTVLNTFTNSQDINTQLGIKLSALSLTPRYGLLIPSLNLVGLPVLFLALLCLTTGMLFSKDITRISLLPSLFVISLTTLCFTLSIYDRWEHGTWLIGFLTLISIPSLAYRLNPRPNVDENFPTNKLSYIILLVVFLFGLWIRISAVQFGLPHLYHPDEARKSIIAMGIVKTGQLDPHYFRHPSFMLYSTALLGKIKSVISGHEIHITEILPLGRSVSAVLGALSIIILFSIGRLLYGNFAGLVAASLLSVAPLHVVCSRYIKEDVAMIFFSLVSLLLILNFILRSAKPYLFYLSSLLAGFATSTKYTGILSVGFIFIPLGIHIVILLSKILKKDETSFITEMKSFQSSALPFNRILFLTVLGVMFCIVGFLLITPYSVLDSERFVRDFLFEKAHMDRGHTGAISAAAYFWIYHLKNSILPAFTSPISWMTLIAMGFLLGRCRPADILVVFTILLFYLPAEFVKAKPYPQPERYILPCIPLLALAAGALCSFLVGIFARGKRETVKAGACVVTILTLVFLPAHYSLMHRKLALSDTRAQATEWVEAHIPPGSKIVTDWTFYSPHFSYGKYEVLELKSRPGDDLLTKFSLRELRKRGTDYLVVSSFFYKRYIDQVQRGSRIGIGFKEIFDTIPPEANFTVGKFSYGFHNPDIKIFKIS